MRRYTVTVDGTPFTIDVQETAADRFRVTIDGQTLEASLEAEADLPGTVVTPGLALPIAPTAPAVSPLSGSITPGALTAPPGTTAGGMPSPMPPTPVTRAPVVARVPGIAGLVVAAPMPGVILEVHATVGAGVRRGDPLLVLEAMKMRNTIRAPRDGVILEVTTEAGRPVVPGEPLVRLGDAPE